MIITIDGPASSGKSSAAVALSKELHMSYLNSGMLYRYLAYLLSREYNYSLQDLKEPKDKDINELLSPKNFDYDFETKQYPKLLYKGEDVTPQLKTKEIDEGASILSLNPNVRTILLEWQRNFAKDNNIVVDGRDTGSVVFPNADIKFFLTANVEERAKRWKKAQEDLHGYEVTLEKAIKILEERDSRDISRDIAPLIVPQNAIIIDNSDMNLSKTIEVMMSAVQKITNNYPS